MISILRRAIALVALAVGIGVAAGAAPASAATGVHQHLTSTHPVHLSHRGAPAFAQPDDWWF